MSLPVTLCCEPSRMGRVIFTDTPRRSSFRSCECAWTLGWNSQTRPALPRPWSTPEAVGEARQTPSLPSLSSPAPRRASYLGRSQAGRGRSHGWGPSAGRPVPGDRPAVLSHQRDPAGPLPPTHPPGSRSSEVAANRSGGFVGTWLGFWRDRMSCWEQPLSVLSVPLAGFQASPLLACLPPSSPGGP